MDIQIIALLVAPATAVAALLYGIYLVRKVFRKPEGTPDMVAISQAIREGASAYIKKQFTVILPLVVILAAILVFAIKPLSIGLGTALAFLVGAVFSGLAGHFGMWVATRANVRVTEAAKKGLLNPPLTIAFAGGTVNGMLIVGLGLLGVSIIYIIFRGQATDVLVGFGFGAALLALFMRVGGGIYTKAADVGADLVGKIEAGIPEDDPRNAAVIADNVGDNVGDCAGMGADIFESYAVTIVAAMILGHLMFGIKGVVFPLLARSAGIISSILGTLIVKAKSEEEHPMTPIFKGFALSAVLAAIFFGLFAYFILGNPVVIQDVGAIAKGTHYTWWQILLAAMVGLATTVIIGWWTNYYTSTEAKPVREIAKSAQTGAATNIITGLAFGMESSVAVISMVAAAVVISYFLAGPYGIALCGMGMLAPTGIIMSMDSFGPIADNAAGIAEMTGVLKGRAEKIMISLDAVGNTTKALTKGFAISSAAVAAVALFQTFIEKGHILRGIQINQPLVLVGLFLGGALPFLFSSLTIKAVGRTAFKVVEEVRRQFREIKGLMEGKAKPEYARCVSIVTDGAIRELIVPALVVVILPVAVGFILGAPALGAFLGGAILVAQLMAIFQSNAGGAWDNAKKYIEDGHLGGKGTPTHAAAVTGDTVGDPLKDTSGPALNPMIKVVNIVALLVAPLLTSIGSLLK